MEIESLERLLVILVSRKDLKWLEYRQIRSEPGRYFKGIKNKKVRITLLRTICPRSLIKIEFRFILAGDSRLSAYVYELNLIDELQRFERKDLLRIVKRKGQEEIPMLEFSFDAIKNDATFLQKKKERMSTEEIIKLMQEC